MANWKKLRAEYVAGAMSYRQLADKHGVPFDTLSKRAKREGWADARREAGEIVAAELPAAVAEKMTKSLAEYLAGGLEALDEALGITREKMRAAEMEFKSLGEAVSALAKVAKAQSDIVARVREMDVAGADDDEDFNGSLFGGDGDDDEGPSDQVYRMAQEVVFSHEERNADASAQA